MIPLDHSAWKARAKALKIETGLFIDGAFSAAADGARLAWGGSTQVMGRGP